MRKKPTAIKKLEGTFRKDRAPAKEVSFTPVAGVPDPPDYFGSVARREWFSLIPELKEAGTLEMVDLVQLRLYCWNIQVIEECTKVINNEGLTSEITNKGGHTYKVPHPNVRIMNDAVQIVSRIAGRFGFDPASRTKVGTTEKKPNDPFAAIMKKAI